MGTIAASFFRSGRGTRFMKDSKALSVTLSISMAMLVVLIGATAVYPPSATLFLPMLLFVVLILFSLSFSITWASGMASMLPLLSATSFLVMGVVPAAWVMFVGSLLHGFIRFRFRRQLRIAQVLDKSKLLSRTAVNAFNNTLSTVIGGLFFRLIISEQVGSRFSLDWIGALFYFALGYFLVNYGIIILYLTFFERLQLKSFISRIPQVLTYEAAPIIFTPFVADVYTRLGIGYFALFSLIVVGFSIITHNLDRTRQGLEWRLQELDGLQMVGQALSSSLEMDKVLQAIYEQVRSLMPADTFYVALYDGESGQISFPFFIREGEVITWPSRRPANGLTEYVLRTRCALLISENFEQRLSELKLEKIGVIVSSWLGVPILAGEQVLGVISVQSVPQEGMHTRAHQRLLETIATQAALAIQNARLYARINSFLHQRVQELNSVFRTTQDGILLLGRHWEMLAVNRAFSGYVGLIGVEPLGQKISKWPEDGGTLLTRLGYSVQGWRQDCQKLLQDGEGAQLKKQIVMLGNGERHVARTVTAVYDANHAQVMGWLIVLRDVSEEVELARLREEMMHMLVHDLRAPLSILMGALEMGRTHLLTKQVDQLSEVLSMAEQNGERMLRLINDLLDIYKLEHETVPLQLQWVPVRLLLQDVGALFATIVQESQLNMLVDVPDGLPPLHVDHDYVMRLFYNLVDNAVKFTPDNGRIRLWATLDDSMMLVGVSDTGPGISPSVLPRLFEKFERGDAVGRRRGTGLGLPYCKLVAEAHQGEIWVESDGEAGQGSTFIVRLPVVPVNLLERSHEQVVNQSGG